MDTVEPAEQKRNTVNLSSIRTASESEKRICRCGREIEPIIFGTVCRYPESCVICRQEAKEAERLKRLRQRIHDKHRKEAAELRRKIEKVIPPLFMEKKAHIKNISANLRGIMLSLRDDKGLYLFGPAGVGKTFAMCALARYFICKGASVERITFEDLLLVVRSCYTSPGQVREKELMEKFRRCDKLFIEDLGTTVGFGGKETDFSLRILYSILDWRIENRKATFITSNKPLAEMKSSFDSRIADRLSDGCRIIPVSGTSKRT